MRILVVCQYYYPENVVITSICQELVRRGHSVLVVTGKPNYGFGEILPEYDNISEETIHGVRVHRCNLKPRGESKRSLAKNYLSFYFSSKRYLKRLNEEFDLVYSMEMSPITAVAGANVYAKRHHVPHLLHCLDLWPESVVVTGAFKRGSLPFRLLYSWSRRIYSGASKILISSPSFARYFSDCLHLRKDVSFIAQPPLIPEAGSLPIVFPAKYNFVYAGNVGRLQLIENFVKACEPFKSQKDFAFYVIGNGSRVMEVKSLIDKLGLQKTVHYRPTMASAEAAAYFPNATALIVPLLNTNSPVSKTIPNKLISSLYYARPILGCIKGDGATVLKRAGGTVFAANYPADISKAFKEIMSLSEKKRSQMGANNRKYFDANFRFDKIIDQLIDEFKAAIKR